MTLYEIKAIQLATRIAVLLLLRGVKEEVQLEVGPRRTLQLVVFGYLVMSIWYLVASAADREQLYPAE